MIAMWLKSEKCGVDGFVHGIKSKYLWLKAASAPCFKPEF